MKLQGFVIAMAIIGVSVCTAEELSLTIYRQNYGIVRETNTVTLPAGRSEIRHEVISKFLLDEPIRFSSRDLRLLQQRYEYDVPTLDFLLEKNVGKIIELDLIPDSRIPEASRPLSPKARGILLSDLSGKDRKIGNRLLLKESDGSIRTIRRSSFQDDCEDFGIQS